MKKCWVWYVAILLSACSMHKVPLGSQVKMNFDNLPFYAIYTSGYGKIELEDGHKCYQVIFSPSKRRNNNDYNYRIKDGILYLSGRYQAEKVRILVPKIRSLTATEFSTISSKHLHSSALILKTEQDGSILLDGTTVNIKCVTNLGSGNIMALWVDNSDDPFEINNYGTGKIELFGKAKEINCDLKGKSQTLARYLTTKKAKIYAQQKAKAEFTVLSSLEVQGKNNSEIKYFDPQPSTLDTNLADRANLLHWHSYEVLKDKKVNIEILDSVGD